MKGPESRVPGEPVYYYNREERLARSRSLDNCPRPSSTWARNKMVLLTFINVFALFILGNIYLHFLSVDPNVVETADLKLVGEGLLHQGQAYLTIKATAKQERSAAASVARFEVLDSKGGRRLEVYDNLPLHKDEQRVYRLEVPGAAEKSLAVKIGIQDAAHSLTVRLKE